MLTLILEIVCKSALGIYIIRFTISSDIHNKEKVYDIWFGQHNVICCKYLKTFDTLENPFQCLDSWNKSVIV